MPSAVGNPSPKTALSQQPCVYAAQNMSKSNSLLHALPEDKAFVPQPGAAFRTGHRK